MKLVLSHRMSITEGIKAIWYEPEKPAQFIAEYFGDFTLIETVVHGRQEKHPRVFAFERPRFCTVQFDEA